MVLATAQTPPCWAERKSRALLFSRTSLARESQGFCWAAVLAVDSVVFPGVKERIPVTALFTRTPTQGSRGLPKGYERGWEILFDSMM